ncbi:Transcription factor jun-B [Echinococcus granulosus]|uniref:Transcription factor jun-B n=1 Tax=Echinococcus granulosus TaxID=6210 RepID=W6UP86_ECHGR|nr:Transcription factor jun-B [Echinococcus granulosus]EUB55234.1 Transcription factor jun-B [Echinococcus granulosus]
MIDDRINESYLSAEVAQVPESVSHRVMSHYCVDIQDQAPPRPASLSLRFDSSSNNYVDLKSHQISRGYHSVKRSDSMDRDKVIGQLENNGSTPMTPTSFLNPKEITAEQEQFAEQLTKTIDKIKSEREGSLVEEIHLQHHPSSNTSPGYAPTDRVTNPPTPSPQATQAIRVKLGDDETDGAATAGTVPSSPMLLSDVASIHTAFSMAPAPSICTNPSAAVAAALHNLRAQDGGTTGSPPSTTGDSTSPSSPSLENPTVANRYPNVTTAAAINNRYPSLSLPPLRTDVADGGGGGGGGNTYASVGLADILVGSAEDPVPPTPVGGASALADLTAAVTGQVIVNPTTDGFLHLFHHSTDQEEEEAEVLRPQQNESSSYVCVCVCMTHTDDSPLTYTRASLFPPTQTQKPNPLMDPNGSRGSGALSQRHLTNLVSYDSHSLAHPRQLHDYIPSNMASSYTSEDQQQQQESMMLPQKRSLSSTTSMTPPPSTVKRSRRRHEPTIAAAQALINATSNSMGQLSYAPTDVANMVGLKMEDRPVTHQPIQPAVNTTSNAGSGRRVGVPTAGGQLTSQSMPITYESQPISRPDASLASMEEEMCSDPSMLKIEKKRARNRLAARRCRERKVNRIATLESEVAMLNTYVEQLRSQLETAQKEANQLRLYLEQLSESYPGLQDKLKSLIQPTSQVVPPSSSLHPPPPLPES